MKALAREHLRPYLPNGRLRHMLIGYARVSKTDGSHQSLDLQRDTLRDDRPGLDTTTETGPARHGPLRHLSIPTLPRTRHHARDALQVRRAAGPVAPAGTEGFRSESEGPRRLA